MRGAPVDALPARRLQWTRMTPPFILGVALALAAMTSVGLLLYGGAGMIQALAVILATLLGSLGAGVAAGRAWRGPGPVEALRRRWLLTLVAFTLAALFAAGWEGFRGFGARALTQGLGLAVLGALPLFAGGMILGTLGRLSDTSEDVLAPGTAALFGGAAGTLFLGFLLFPFLSSAGILLACLVALSGAALIQGRALDTITFVRDENEDTGSSGRDALSDPSPRGSPRPSAVHVERWIRGDPPIVRTVVLDEDRIRLIVGEGGGPILPLDRMLVDEVARWAPSPGRALVLGAGGGLLARRLWERWDGRGGNVVLFERDAAVLAALREALQLPETNEVLALRSVPVAEALVGSPAHLPPASYDLIYLDTLSVSWRASRVSLPPGAIARVSQALRPEGILVVAPLQDGEGEPSLLDRARGMSALFTCVSVYVGPQGERGPPHGIPANRREAWRRSHPVPGARSGVLVAARGGGVSWPDRIDAYLRVRLEG